MAKWATARRLKDLEDVLFESFPQAKTLVVVATSAQKYFLKNALLQQRKGAWGAEIVTVSEYKRQCGAIMNFELAVVLACRLQQKNLKLSQTLVKDLVDWVSAGHAAVDIPLADEFKAPLLRLYDEIEQTQKAPWKSQYLPAQAILVGFGLVEADKIVKQNPQSQLMVFAIEPNVLSRVQQAARASLEKHFGEPVILGDQTEPCVAIQTSSDNLLPAIKDTLEKNPHIKRIVYKSDAVGALLGDVFKPTKPQSPWMMHQRLSLYKKAGQSPSFNSVLDFLRHEAIHKAELGQNLAKSEKRSQQYWQNEGLLPVSLLSEFWQEMPMQATIEEFLNLTQALWEDVDDVSSQVRYLLPLEDMLPNKKLPRDIWLSIMSVAARTRPQYGALWAVPEAEALGLLDDQTLLLVGSQSQNITPTHLDMSVLEQTNQAQIKIEDGEEFLDGIWLERDATTPPYQEYELSTMIATCPMPEELEHVRYEYEASSSRYTQVAQVQKQRRNPKESFGAYDNALSELYPTCKQWEGVLMEPEIAWYDIQKIRPQWKGGREDYSLLWVGNWVHDAMAHYPQQKDYLKEFEQKDGSLAWRMALKRAQGVVDSFVDTLETQLEFETVESEMDVAGEVVLGETSISTRGRIDRLLKSEDGLYLVIDFKTSNGNKKIGKAIERGDGLQLWLYAALVSQMYPQAHVGVCRMGRVDELGVQREYSDEIFEALETLSQIAQTKILGHKGDVWSSYGASNRLPLAALPIDAWVCQKRQEVSR